ncbi:MAG: hypothetical protein AAGF35_04300, partial [Pseudomonadota bacterium]
MSNTRAHSVISHLLILTGLLLLVLSFGYTEMASGDLWWQIAAGRELIQTQTLRLVDDWSFTAMGSDWLNHEWLAGLTYYGWTTLWGLEALVYWKWLVLLVTFGALQIALTRHSQSAIAALITTVIAIATAAPFLDIRPHLYSLLGYTLLLLMALGRRPNIALLILLFVVWVNLHSGVLFGLMVLAVLLCPWREPSMATFRFAAIVVLLCVLASMINPYGYDVFLYPLGYALDASSPFRTIAEWASPFEPGGIRSPLYFYLIWLPILALLYAFRKIRSETGIPWEGVALTALTLAMSLTSRRFIPLYAISLAVLFAPLLALGLRRLRLEKYGWGFGLLAIFLGLYRLQPYPLHPGPAFHYMTAHYIYPVELVNFVEANNISGNVYGAWRWGGYLHYRTDGALRVFVDGRADTVFDDETYLHYADVQGSQPGWLKMIEETGADYVLWSFARGEGVEKLQALVKTGRWQLIYVDAVGWLVARKGLLDGQRFRPSQAGPWREASRARNALRARKYEDAIRYAQITRETMPWHKEACSVLISSFEATNRPQKA